MREVHLTLHVVDWAEGDNTCRSGTLHQVWKDNMQRKEQEGSRRVSRRKKGTQYVACYDTDGQLCNLQRDSWGSSFWKHCYCIICTLNIKLLAQPVKTFLIKHHTVFEKKKPNVPSSRLVRRNGPKWLVAKEKSNPSSVMLWPIPDGTIWCIRLYKYKWAVKVNVEVSPSLVNVLIRSSSLKSFEPPLC